MTKTDQKIVEIMQWLRLQENSRDVARKLYTSFYYNFGPINDLMECGWPSAVQHDYPELFKDPDDIYSEG